MIAVIMYMRLYRAPFAGEIRREFQRARRPANSPSPRRSKPSALCSNTKLGKRYGNGRPPTSRGNGAVGKPVVAPATGRSALPSKRGFLLYIYHLSSNETPSP